MHNPESGSKSPNQQRSNESIRATEMQRGDMTNRAKLTIEQQERQKELMRRKAELEAKLRAAGVDPEPIILKARADFIANRQKTVNTIKESQPDLSRATSPEPAPESQPSSQNSTNPIEDYGRQAAEYADNEFKKEDEEEDAELNSEDAVSEEAEEIEDVEEDEDEFLDDDLEDDYEDEPQTEISPAALANKAKKKRGLRIAIGAIVATAAITIGVTALSISNFFRRDKKVTPSANQITTESSISNEDDETPDSGVSGNSISGNEAVSENGIEKSNQAGETIYGVTYDSSEYFDIDNKVSRNAYGYDQSSQSGDRGATVGGIMTKAKQLPEILASYAYNIFTNAEKQDLGIADLTMTQIDHKFDQAGGGELQQKLLDKLQSVLDDEKNTRLNFYNENGTERTNYVYAYDKNGDGVYTPDEFEIGYDTKKRDGAPQVDIYRIITNADGTTKEVKMLDLNMRCGYQPNYQVAPKGVKHVKSNPVKKQVAQPAVQQQPITPVAQSAPVAPGVIYNQPAPTIVNSTTTTINKNETRIINRKVDQNVPSNPVVPNQPVNPVPDQPVVPVVPPPINPVVPPNQDILQPKDEDAERKNAGDYVTQLPLDENVTPKTTLEQDQQNFEEIERQRQEAAAAAEEAERVAREQEAREAAAREEAENREQPESTEEQERQADEAAENAESGASEEQAAHAEEEAERAREEESREEAQEESDRNDFENQAESESNNDNTASERSSDFENGNF